MYSNDPEVRRQFLLDQPITIARREYEELLEIKEKFNLMINEKAKKNKPQQ